SGQKLFLKSGRKSRIYQCEANGLKELEKFSGLRVPKVIAVDEDFILTEYIEAGMYGKDFFKNFGAKLAQLHQFTNNTFGFYENNFIGNNPQLNRATPEKEKDWITFYFNKRLAYQFHLAEERGYLSAVLQRGFLLLKENIQDILKNSEEPPTLLHGDLWNENFLCDQQGEPVIIDPAVYYGHREADLAMTKLFGGFPPEFYASYQRTYPLKQGWEYRENIYKLYHVMNHLNLFGRGYLSEAEWTLKYYFSDL
ncbi:MAG: fructosamine kinase family protein, partial [Odoribacter sp.]|nr:fructosamine kinase family protein [Odoribacter sp.]